MSAVEPFEAGQPVEISVDWFPEGRADLPEGLPIEVWAVLGKYLQRMDANVQFWIGDHWNYGVRTYGEERATQAIGLGRASETCRRFGWVAEHVPVSVRRRTKLSYTHHAEVAAKPPEEQERLLEKAEAEGWSAKTLRRYARDPHRPTVECVCLTCGHTHWRDQR